MKKSNITFTFLILFIVLGCSFLSHGDTRITIAIQPFDRFTKEEIHKITSGIKSMYKADVVLLPLIPLPRSAYYSPRRRYRADKLLDFFRQHPSRYEKYGKVLGLTKKDISTTKGTIYDWGIFGLGSIGGKHCVVSTFRLKRGGVSTDHFYFRLIKIINHELGHTFGLYHCPYNGCLMQDAKGTIKTVDNESGKLCDECRNKISHTIKNVE